MADQDPELPVSPRRKVSQRSATVHLATSPRQDALMNGSIREKSRHSEKRAGSRDSESSKLSSDKKGKEDDGKKHKSGKSRSVGRSASNQIIKELDKYEVCHLSPFCSSFSLYLVKTILICFLKLTKFNSILEEYIPPIK